MVYYDSKDYKLIRFEESHLCQKKYDAILQNKSTKREVIVSFGAKNYQQYEDKVPLQLYSSLNHYDKKRRDRYRARHAHDINLPYSPSWFSLKYLW